jgi:hypothetical protein
MQMECARMDELREAVTALFEAALAIKSRMADFEDPSTKSQLGCSSKKRR